MYQPGNIFPVLLPEPGAHRLCQTRAGPAAAECPRGAARHRPELRP
ncbi:Uncharacterised protein [Amycolatopsis camponoti]|uniref:Uncharacterized protein n=1 Tax=Amycolatopsis camponoti TaxID=2606593 RepID=A0A6I8LUF5_9PSEU|nr:Uncharacterised protein [Amycolatopsis camponoti]